MMSPHPAGLTSVSSGHSVWTAGHARKMPFLAQWGAGWQNATVSESLQAIAA